MFPGGHGVLEDGERLFHSALVNDLLSKSVEVKRRAHALFGFCWGACESTDAKREHIHISIQISIHINKQYAIHISAYPKDSQRLILSCTCTCSMHIICGCMYACITHSQACMHIVYTCTIAQHGSCVCMRFFPPIFAILIIDTPFAGNMIWHHVRHVVLGGSYELQLHRPGPVREGFLAVPCVNGNLEALTIFYFCDLL